MAVVAEELISDLIVRDGKLRSGIRSAQQAYGAGIGSMRNDTRRFESEFNRSAGNISSGFKSLAGTLAAGVSVAATGQLIDSFTRLQNSLRVAGLEGKNLEAVQSDLLDLSTRYGVNVEGLANLYGKATDAGKSFGASQAQILQLTEATSQSLLITGTRAEQASGAILGLSQALASGTVRAEEFNQINEGGLRPLLQAAAATERFGGDINKLRAAVLEGTVSSKEFFNAIMAGSAQLEGQAARATLTLSGAFEALNSSLTVYVGTAAQSNGVTAALAGGIKLLADNLETIIPALAIIAAAVGVKYTVALGRATAATVAQSVAATRAAQTQAFLNAVMAESTVITNIYGASAVRTTTAMATMGTAARAAGASLLAAFGGPVSAAIIAVTAALAGLAYATRDTSASLEELQATSATAQARLEDARKQAAAAGIDIKTMGDQADSASGSFAGLNKVLWASVDAMIAASQSAKNLALARIQLENAEARSVIAQVGPRVEGLDAAASRNRRFNAALGQQVTGYEQLGEQNRANLDIDRARLGVAQTTLKINEENKRIIEALDTYVEPGGGGGATGGTDADTKKGKSRRGPTQAEINERFSREIEQYTQQILGARESLATTAEDEAELANRSLEVARRAALNELEANEDYSKAQKKELRRYIERLAEVERETISRRESLRLSEEAADLAATQNDLQQQILQNAEQLADTQGERRRLALESLDNDYRLRRAELDRIIATEGIAKALKDKAIAERAQLDQITQGRRDSIIRDTENPLERLARESNRTAAQVTEDIQSIQAEGLNALGDGITDVIMQTRSLGDVFKSVANQIIADLIRIAVQRAIIGPLANALFPGSGGSGLGDAFSAIGNFGLTGLAGGGRANAGQLYRVNEGQREFFRPATSGQVIPLSAMTQAQAARPASSGSSGPTIVQLAVAPGEMFVPIVEGISGNVAVRTVQATAPGIVQAANINTTRRAVRPRL